MSLIGLLSCMPGLHPASKKWYSLFFGPYRTMFWSLPHYFRKKWYPWNGKGVVVCHRTVDGRVFFFLLLFFSFFLLFSPFFLLFFLLLPLSFILSFLFFLPPYFLVLTALFLVLTALFFGPYRTISKKSGTHNEYQKSPG